MAFDFFYIPELLPLLLVVFALPLHRTAEGHIEMQGLHVRANDDDASFLASNLLRILNLSLLLNH